VEAKRILQALNPNGMLLLCSDIFCSCCCHKVAMVLCQTPNINVKVAGPKFIGGETLFKDSPFLAQTMLLLREFRKPFLIFQYF
jgi:hypothetical protein